jgi:predicted outer membrane repeat protein
MRRLLTLAALTLLITLAIALPSRPTRAATFTVTNTNATGAGSLAQAVEDANAIAGPDLINFNVSGTINLTGNPPLILQGDLTIDGAGQTITLTNSGATTLQVALGANVTLQNLTIAGATGTAPSIVVFGTLDASNMTFNGNVGVGGAAIYNEGSATITNCTFINNVAQVGGAIFNNNGGVLTVSSSTFTGNSTLTGQASGGAIFNFAGGTATITGSTFTGNQAGDDGGAIANGGVITISGSTFTNNQAGSGVDNRGGALANGGIMTVTGSAFSGNTAFSGSVVAQQNIGFPLNTTISSSNFLGNPGTAVEWIAGPTIDARNNFWNSATGPSGAAPGTGDAISINVLYDPFITGAQPVVSGPVSLTGPDDRINPGQGDTYAAVYVRRDDEGRAAIHIYCVNNQSQGYLGLVVTQDAVEAVDAAPEINTLVAESDFCNVAFYALTSGEYQINIGPDRGGDVRVLIFRGLNAGSLRFSGFNVFGID